METDNTLDNQASILDLINTIQTKLNNENNITYNEQNMTGDFNKEDLNCNENTKISENVDQNTNQNIDFSSMLNNLNIQQLISNFKGNANQNSNEDSGFNLGDIDPNTILKFQKILSSFNRNDPKKNLIKSLKPFLRKSRQDKIQEYIMMLSIVDAIGIFNSKGSD